MKFVRVIIIYLLIQEVQGSIYCLEKQGGLCNHSPNEKQFFRNSVLMKWKHSTAVLFPPSRWEIKFQNWRKYW